MCFDFVYGWKHFGRLVVLLVCINTCIQMAIYGPEPDSWYRAQNAIDAIFVVLYTIELVLKLGAEKNLRCCLMVSQHETRCSDHQSVHQHYPVKLFGVAGCGQRIGGTSLRLCS